jgi:translation initiation factor 1 (eIF-1/SUI1)
MKTYKFAVEVKDVTGTQTFAVEADSAEAALAKIRAGEGEIVEENLEVQGLEWHTAIDVTDE